MIFGELAYFHEKAAARAFLAEPITCYDGEGWDDYVIHKYSMRVVDKQRENTSP